MKKESSSVNKYPGKEKYVANFAVTSWLEKRYKKILEGGNEKRIKKYEGITPAKLLVEEPTVLNRKKGYFRSTIIARSNGLLFPDPKINFFTFEKFLTHIDPDKKLYKKEGIPETVTLDELNQLAKQTLSFPVTPEYALTKISDNNHYALLVYSDSLLLDLDEIIVTLFDNYLFQEITGYSLEKDDADYPANSQDTIEGYITGSVELKDVLLSEQTVTIDILNIHLIKKLMEVHEYYYNGQLKYNGEITYSGGK